MIPIRMLIFILLVVAASSSQAQTPFDKWVDSQIDAALQKEQVAANGKGTDRQRESPSADPRSTSLVDQSSASDFISVAANVIPVTPGLSQFTSASGSTSSDSSAAGSTTATVSLYALLAAFNKQAPTDPEFYAAHIFSRRLFFTIGTAASKQATDNTDKPAAVYGAKYLVINGRELFTEKNKTRIKDVQDAVSRAAKESSALKLKLTLLIFLALNPNAITAQGLPDPIQLDTFVKAHFHTEEGWQSTLAALSSETKKQIQTLIQGSIDAFAAERKVLQKKYDEISKAMQMSLSYTADIRDAQGNNDHRGELIFDYGLSSRITWTVNASADYTERKSATSSTGGRFATSFQGNLTKTALTDVRTPMRLTFSGEGKWLTSQKPQYTFEAGLVIPVVSGVDLPIVYRYANRTAQINQKDSEARLGFSIDLSHLTQAFK